MKVEEVLSRDNGFKYQLLSRLQSDIPYFIETGDANALWAQSPKEQIKYMKAIYNSFKKNEKPEWLSMEDIKSYARDMGVSSR